MSAALPTDVSGIVAAHADEAQKIAQQLQQVVAKHGDTTYLIVSAGDVYVQYISIEGSALAIEAVSNPNLPDDLRIGDEGIRVLHALGFEDPDPEIEGANYAMDRDGAGAAMELAAIALVAIYGAYGCDADTELEYELSLD